MPHPPLSLLLPLSFVVASLLVTGCGAANPAPDPRGDPTPTGPPALVTAPAGFVATGTGPVFPGPGEHLEADPEQALLVGPHSAVAVSRVTVTTEIEADHAAAAALDAAAAPDGAAALDGQEHGWRAADGHEFLVVRTAKVAAQRQARLLNPTDVDIQVSIHAGDQIYQLDRALADPDRTAAPATIAISAAVGADVRLVLSDAGREQSLDLRTGEPGDDAIPLLYQAWNDRPADDFLAWIALGGVLISEGDLVIEGSIAGMSLFPYLPETGWAEPGRAWLRVRLDDETWQVRGLIQVTAVITLDAAESFTLVEPGGRTSRPEPAELTVRFAIPTVPTRPVGGPLVFDVADDFRTGTLGFTPTGTVTASSGDEGTVRTAHPSEPIPVELSRSSR